ncbi:MAG: hypothetical protein U0167_15200 [bacterium]
MRDEVGAAAPRAHQRRDSGAVYLDHDLFIAPGQVLEVRGGAQADTGAVNTGRDPHRIELVVQGTLRVSGESTGHVTFPLVNGDDAGWGGILVDLKGSEGS